MQITVVFHAILLTLFFEQSNSHFTNIVLGTCSRNITTITTNTSARHKPIMGKLTKYRNARRFHAGDSSGSSRPVTELITKGP